MSNTVIKLLMVSAVCFGTTAVYADCVCGTQGCKACTNAEEFLEERGEMITDHAKNLKKTAWGLKDESSSAKVESARGQGDCVTENVAFFMEQADVLEKNGQVVLWYADVMEDDVLPLKASDYPKAKADAQNLVATGTQMKTDAAAKKAACAAKTVEIAAIEDDVIATAMKGHQEDVISYLEIVEQNGDALIASGEMIESKLSP